MSRGRLQRLLGLASVTAALACSLIVDTAEIDSGCGAGKKFCGGACVPTSDPSYGCTDDACDPCQRDRFGELFGASAVPRCEAGQCVVDTCVFGYGCPDCRAQILTDDDNCGFCGHACQSGWCSLGECVGAGGAGGEAGN